MNNDSIRYIPVCPEHNVGGPIGYVREEQAGGVCPIIAYREPEIAEAMAEVRAALGKLIETRRQV